MTNIQDDMISRISDLYTTLSNNIQLLESDFYLFCDSFSRVNNGYIKHKFGNAPIVAAKEVDSIVKDKLFCQKISAIFPELVKDFDANNQVHITNKQINGSPTIKIHNCVNIKPLDNGFYTSTIIRAFNDSMWGMYLRSFNNGEINTDFKRYRLVFKNPPNIYEINNAAAWKLLVEKYHYTKNNELFPDWILVGKHYDAVHINLSGIVAIQGYKVDTKYFPIHESYWDVESTLWLNKCFDLVTT